MRQLHLDMDHFLKERAALYVSERVLFPLSLFLTLSTPFFKFFCSPCLPDSEGLGSVTSSIENDISSDKVERRGLSFIASSFFFDIVVEQNLRPDQEENLTTSLSHVVAELRKCTEINGLVHFTVPDEVNPSIFPFFFHFFFSF